MPEIYQFLNEHGIAYERFDHPAVFTCEEADRLLPAMPGVSTKNLFLRDRKGTRHILVVVPSAKNTDLRELCRIAEIDKLSFASPERLKKYLGVEPGSATLLGLLCDTDNAVELIIDEVLWHADALQCHPLVNTATLVLPHAAIIKFLEITGHMPRILVVPERLAKL